MQLLGKSILIRPIKSEETTDSGIVLTDEATAPLKGKVVMVGPKAVAQVGDIVYYDKTNNNMGVNYRGDTLYIMNESFGIAID